MSCVAYVPDHPGDDKYGQCKKQRGRRSCHSSGMNRKEVLAPRRWPALSGQGVTWTLHGPCCLGGLAGCGGRVVWGGGVGRAPPWRQLRTDRKSQVSWVDKGRQVPDIAEDIAEMRA